MLYPLIRLILIVSEVRVVWNRYAYSSSTTETEKAFVLL